MHYCYGCNSPTRNQYVCEECVRHPDKRFFYIMAFERERKLYPRTYPDESMYGCNKYFTSIGSDPDLQLDEGL